MRIAVTGASGFIGSVLAGHLHEAGHEVTALVRSGSRRDHIEPHVDRFVEGSQEDQASWPELLDGAEAVVHNSFDFGALAADGDLDRHWRGNLLGSIRLLQASAPRPFVFLSSIAVHHDMRPRWRGRIDEDHPLRPATLYGACKAAVEDHLWAARFQESRSVCALRPCAVYGIDPRLERSIGFPVIRKILASRAYGRAGGGKFVHVDDVAATAVAAVADPGAAGVVINLADCYARWSDWARYAAELLGVEATIDETSPPSPANEFTKDAAAALGVRLDRGHEGIRMHLRELVDVMRSRGALSDAP